MAKPKEEYKSHLVVPDPQVKPNSFTHHLEAAGRMAIHLKPDVIVLLGDFWDMKSLNLYDIGKKAAEGARYMDDIRAGNEAMRHFLAPIMRFRKTKSGRSWNPRMVFLIGNHEFRILRHVNTYPVLEDKLGYHDLLLESWEVYGFREVIEIDGIHYSHYFYNHFTGKPIGGGIDNMLNKIGMSFTQGHRQTIQIGRKDLANGTSIQGCVAGSFYLENEDYKGPQANDHFRGLIYKHDVYEGNYDIETWSIDRMMKNYG